MSVSFCCFFFSEHLYEPVGKNQSDSGEKKKKQLIQKEPKLPEEDEQVIVRASAGASSRLEALPSPVSTKKPVEVNTREPREGSDSRAAMFSKK